MRTWLLLLGLLAVAAVLGCGELDDALDAAQARLALAVLGIDYTERAFRAAAGDGDLAVVKLFVAAGMSVDARGWSGRTALMYAARGGNLEVVEYLLGQGASLTGTDSGGETALHDAVAGGRLEVVKYLVGQGADVGATDDEGWTPLIRAAAARSGRLEIVKYLVEQGAALNARTNNGETALIRAAFWGRMSVVKYLVEQGADVQASDDDGDTALLVARVRGHTDIAEYIAEYLDGLIRSIPYNIESTRVAADNFLRVKIDPDFESGRNFVLSGTFEVTYGGSRDINAYIVDEIGYKNFRNKNNFRALFSATRVTTERFSVALGQDDTYYFILSNRFSWLTAKTVRAEIELRYEEK